MIRSGFLRVSVLRIAVTVVLAVDLFSLFMFLGDARADALTDGIALTDFDDLLSRTAVRGIVALIGVAAAVAFGRRPGRLWEGMLALSALALLSTAHAQLFGSPWRHLYYSGLCLSGWLLGLAVSRFRGAPTDESYARVGSMALLGAAYLNAGISKFVYGGLDWISGIPIQAIIIGQDGMVGDSIVSVYRSWVVATPAVASFFSIATLGFELAGPLMLAGRKTRLCVALGLCAMHANIYVLTHILYWQSMVLLILFGLFSDAPSYESVPQSAASIRLHDRMFAGGTALLAFCAFFAISHQALRFTNLEVARSAGFGPSSSSRPSIASAPVPTPPLAPTRPSLRQVGPFAVGQTLAAEWSVDSLAISEDGFIATLSGKPGRARFEVVCAASKYRSPFDLGAAHIFYSSDLEFRDLEAAGLAVQAEVRNAVKGGDICERVESWRTAAQAGQSAER